MSFSVGETTVHLKACPRCTGDTQVTGDYYGDYEACLQCGYQQDIEIEETHPTPEWRNLDETRGRPKKKK
jgi:transcription initiation factor TFIIIB Brf1 subunit/transcription initiation factor TFIIB